MPSNGSRPSSSTNEIVAYVWKRKVIANSPITAISTQPIGLRVRDAINAPIAPQDRDARITVT